MRDIISYITAVLYGIIGQPNDRANHKSPSEPKANGAAADNKKGRRQQSVSDKLVPRTPAAKTADKALRNGFKGRAPSETQNAGSVAKTSKKRTPTRNLEISPRLNFLSPTVSSKIKQSNSK